MMSDQNSSTHTPINITTLNVNGLGLDVKKKQSIFNKLKTENGVIMLQETHSTLTNEKNRKRNGENKFSHGTLNSRSVATLFPRNLDFNILEKYNDENGRFLLLKC